MKVRCIKSLAKLTNVSKKQEKNRRTESKFAQRSTAVCGRQTFWGPIPEPCSEEETRRVGFCIMTESYDVSWLGVVQMCLHVKISLYGNSFTKPPNRQSSTRQPVDLLDSRSAVGVAVDVNVNFRCLLFYFNAWFVNQEVKLQV